MYGFEYQRPTSRDAAKAAATGADTRYLAGGQSLIQAMKLRLSQSERLVDLGGIADLEGDQGRRQRRDDRRDGDARRGRRERRREARLAGARRARRRHRRPDGAQHGNARRLDRQRRPGRLLSGRGGRPGRDDPHRPAHDRRRRVLHRPLRDRAAARRADHRGELSRRRRRRPTSSTSSRRRASRWSACSSRRRRAACASRSPARRAACSAPTAIEDALAKSFTPEAAKAVKMPTTDINGDLHGSAEYRAAMISVMASRAVAAALAR